MEARLRGPAVLDVSGARSALGSLLVLAVLASALWVAWGSQEGVDADRRLVARAQDATSGELAVAGAELAATRGEASDLAVRLYTGGADLAVLQQRLAMAEAEVVARTAERDAVLASVGASTGRAAELETRLAELRDQVADADSTIRSLRACLAGVSAALTAAAVDDGRAASASIAKVEGDCAAARAALAPPAPTAP